MLFDEDACQLLHMRTCSSLRTLEHCHWAHGPWAHRSNRHPRPLCRAQGPVIQQAPSSALSGPGPRAQLGCQIWAEILDSVSTEVPKYFF